MWLRGRELVEGFRCSASIKRTVLDAERSHSAVLRKSNSQELATRPPNPHGDLGFIFAASVACQH